MERLCKGEFERRFAPTAWPNGRGLGGRMSVEWLAEWRGIRRHRHSIDGNLRQTGVFGGLVTSELLMSWILRLSHIVN